MTDTATLAAVHYQRRRDGHLHRLHQRHLHTPATSQINAQPPAVTVTACGGARLGAGNLPRRRHLFLAGGLFR